MQVRFALEGLHAQTGRSVLTVLGVAIGTASVVAVVSVGLLGRAYVVHQIEGVGANLIYASNDEEGEVRNDITFGDVVALSSRTPGVAAVAAVVTDDQQLTIDGRPQQIAILGTPPPYAQVRNLVLEWGRFLDTQDEAAGAKVCVISRALALKLYGTEAIGERWLRLYDLRFHVVGVYREAVESAAAMQQSEAAGLTAMLPFRTVQALSRVRRVDVIYFQAASADAVGEAVKAISATLVSRHRPGARFKVESLQGYLRIVRRVSNALTWGLVGVAAISLLVGGIGIMNIMLVTVAERTQDIGIRMALGATSSDILVQFLVEAAIIGVAGSAVGVFGAVAIPVYVGRIYGVEVPVSGASVLVACSASIGIGLLFGYHPARWAADLNVIDALHRD